MGQTIQELSHKKLTDKPIFPNRFVIEICEKVHTHYRNIRIVNSIHDWVSVAEGYKDALDRWKKRGCPGTRQGTHIELCRKIIQNESESKDILINLNNNLYVENEGRIFSEGANFSEPTYLHVKIGDLRVELTHKQFEELHDAINEAKERLESSNLVSKL